MHDYKQELRATFLDSTYTHTKYKNFPDSFWGEEKTEVTVAREEKFAVQLMLNYSHTEALYTLGKMNTISWKGLIDRVRIDLKTEESLKDNFNISIIGYVKDDTGEIVSDPILTEKSMLAEKHISQCFWIEGTVPSDCDLKEINLKINLFTQKGYEDEEKVKSLDIKVNVIDFTLPKPNECEDFHLDLWQHPSNWARYYRVDLWSDEHFKIIKSNLKELASLGNKVITVIASDFAWVGQQCYKEEKNHSNLFEYNIISLKKTREGKIVCDFEALDRYIELAISLGIDKEIDIFGIIGVWDMGFGSPITDYSDPLRLNYYDESSETLKYIKTKAEIFEYITNIFNHLEEKGWWKIVKIMSDHPVDDKIFEECKDFIKSIRKDVTFKSAIFKEDVMRKHQAKLDEVSLASALSINMINDLDVLKKTMNGNGGKFTWYVCWFPEKPNNFIGSPRIDNRLIGWFTYYFGFDGFLRWDYAIWPKNPWENPSYKFPYWRAGDMFFVYPGSNLEPVRSQRWENLRYGIQDFLMFKALEKRGYDRNKIADEFIKPLLGCKKDIKAISDRSVEMDYCIDYKNYEETREKILDILKTK